MPLARNQYRALRVLVRHNREMNGVEIADAIGGIGRSSIYAALAALQRDGFVTARWDVEGGHPRRLVTITDAGRAALKEEDEWENR
jgi:DNA-binding PadR family transcriptional regulator